MDAMHPYEKLPLFGTGLVFGVVLVAMHLICLLKSGEVIRFLKWFPRNASFGQILLGVGLAWFWLLIAPPNLGLLSSLCMDLGEFNAAKKILWWLVPLSVVLVSMSVRDFLAVRALGLLGLMAAAPLLEAAFLEEPVSRLLITVYAYVLITVSLFLVGKPYVLRDAVNWATANSRRWRMLTMAGLAYGVVVLICCLSFWRGY